MKKIVVLIMVMMCYGGVNAASHEYLPLVEEGKTWHYKLPTNAGEDEDGERNCSLTMKGDTVINGLTYKKVFFTDRKVPAMAWPVAYMREEDKVVTAKANDAAVKWLKGRACHYPDEFLYIDELKYDFNDYAMPNYNAGGGYSNFSDDYNKEVGEDNWYGAERTSVYWWHEGMPALNKNLYEVWLTEGIGLDGDLVHLLKPRVVGWMYGTYTILGKLSHVTNADGVTVYKGRFFRDGSSDVNEVSAVTKVIGEEYYSLSGVKLKASAEGFCIKVTHYADGTVKAVKQFGK